MKPKDSKKDRKLALQRSTVSKLSPEGKPNEQMQACASLIALIFA